MKQMRCKMILTGNAIVVYPLFCSNILIKLCLAKVSHTWLQIQELQAVCDCIKFVFKAVAKLGWQGLPARTQLQCKGSLTFVHFYDVLNTKRNPFHEGNEKLTWIWLLVQKVLSKDCRVWFRKWVWVGTNLQHERISPFRFFQCHGAFIPARYFTNGRIGSIPKWCSRYFTNILRQSHFCRP